MRTLFSNVTLRGSLVDQNMQASEDAVVQLRVYAELGNGAGNNGGADGDVGVVDTSALVGEDGLVKPAYVSLSKMVAGEAFPTPLTLQVNVSEAHLPGTPYPLYVDLLFLPSQEDGSRKRLVPQVGYTLTYTPYLPVLWS